MHFNNTKMRSRDPATVSTMYGSGAAFPSMGSTLLSGKSPFRTHGRNSVAVHHTVQNTNFQTPLMGQSQAKIG